MNLHSNAVLVFALGGALLAQQVKVADEPVKKQTAERTEVTQERPKSLYKLNFSISEVEDGKRLNQRDYTMIGKSNDSPHPSIRIYTRVPVFTKDTQMTYIDAGLDISCSLYEAVQARLEVECDVNISNFVVPEQGPENRTGAPIMRTTHASSWAVLAPGKPSLLSTIDDVNSKKRTQIEVTATRMD